MCIYVYINLHIYTDIHIYVCINIYRESERESGRESERHRKREVTKVTSVILPQTYGRNPHKCIQYAKWKTSNNLLKCFYVYYFACLCVQTHKEVRGQCSGVGSRNRHQAITLRGKQRLCLQFISRSLPKHTHTLLLFVSYYYYFILMSVLSAHMHMHRTQPWRPGWEQRVSDPLQSRTANGDPSCGGWEPNPRSSARMTNNRNQQTNSPAQLLTF